MITALAILFAAEPAMSVPPALPGPCGPVPYRRVEVRSSRGGGGWVVETHAIPRLDVDGHGASLILVPKEQAGATELSLIWQLYVWRGGCGHEVGILGGMAEPFGLDTWSAGLRDLEVVEPSTDPDMQATATVYRFDGRQYKGGRAEPR